MEENELSAVMNFTVAARSVSDWIDLCFHRRCDNMTTADAPALVRSRDGENMSLELPCSK